MKVPQKRGPGRPPLAEGEAKVIMLAIRVSVAEREEIRVAAEAAGTGVTQWAREALLAAARKRKRP